MGVPVFTIYAAGARHVSNVSASLIRNTASQEEQTRCICSNEDDYLKRIDDAAQALPNLFDSEVETIARRNRAQQFVKKMDPERFMREDFEPALLELATIRMQS